MALPEAFQPFLLGMAFLSLALLGYGYAIRGAKKHGFRILGWVLFAAYWPFQAPHFFAIDDPVNGYFTLFGPLFLLYVAYHEWLSLRWREDPRALRWIAGTTFIAATTYFLLYEIPVMTKALIHWTALQTVWMLGWLFGTPARVVDGEDIYLTALGGDTYSVTIILACTAIQSIMIFVGAIATLSASPRAARFRAYVYTVPVIYFLNLFRNSGIVYGYRIYDFPAWFSSSWDTLLGRTGFHVGGVGTAERFDFMHSALGKGGSLVALILIALAVFRTLPELHNNILDIFDLPRRRRRGFFDRKPPGGGVRAPTGAVPGDAPVPPAAGAGDGQALTGKV
ncbi:MAG: archaeosortase A [Methanobacteriota archaeon]